MKSLFAQIFVNPLPALEGDGTPALARGMMIAFGILGGISLIVVVISGLRMTLSRGNPEAIGKLRNTLIYSGVGLGVALGAASILQFVTDAF